MIQFTQHSIKAKKANKLIGSGTAARGLLHGLIVSMVTQWLKRPEICKTHTHTCTHAHTHAPVVHAPMQQHGTAGLSSQHHLHHIFEKSAFCQHYLHTFVCICMKFVSTICTFACNVCLHMLMSSVCICVHACSLLAVI